MPLISRELSIIFDFSSPLATRWSHVFPRDGYEGDITPNFFMTPQVGTGCEFKTPILHPDYSEVLSLIAGRAIVKGPVTKEEGFVYSVQFEHNLEPTGVMAWPIRHPTEQVTMTFMAEEQRRLPPYWRAELLSGLQEGSCGHVIDVNKSDAMVVICIEKPTLGSTLQISWSQNPFEC